MPSAPRRLRRSCPPRAVTAGRRVPTRSARRTTRPRTRSRRNSRKPCSEGSSTCRRSRTPTGSFGRGRYGKHVGIYGALRACLHVGRSTFLGRGPYGDNGRAGARVRPRRMQRTPACSPRRRRTARCMATVSRRSSSARSTACARRTIACVKRSRRRSTSSSAAQNDEGGWRYNPVPVPTPTCRSRSARSWRCARRATPGIKVPKDDDRPRGRVRARVPERRRRLPLHDATTAQLRGREPRRVSRVCSTRASTKTTRSTAASTTSRGDQRDAGPSHRPVAHTSTTVTTTRCRRCTSLVVNTGRTWWPAAREPNCMASAASASGGWLDHYAGGAYSTAMSAHRVAGSEAVPADLPAMNRCRCQP